MPSSRIPFKRLRRVREDVMKTVKTRSLVVFSMIKRICLIGLLIVGSLSVSLADSPLTSTEFWRIYQVYGDDDSYFPLYKVYDETGWGDEVMSILCSSDVSIEQRLCLVNYCGWNIDGQNHYADLVRYCCDKEDAASEKKLLQKMSGEMLIVFAYVKAMDDYFEVSEAKHLADEAVKRSPKSRAVAMIAALIKAQDAMSSDWGEIYRVCHAVETNTSLNNDFCDAAVLAIMEYINAYSKY